MTKNEPKVLLSTLCVIILLSGLAPGAASAAPEPVVWTTLGDPDPNFVPPKAESEVKQRRPQKPAQPSLDQVMEDLGRVVGQAALIQHERTRRIAEEADDAICKSVEVGGASGSDLSGLCP
jgi:hypothetical protein